MHFQELANALDYLSLRLAHTKLSASKMGLIFNTCLAVFAATGSFLFGYDSGVMALVIQSPHFLAFFNTTPESSIIGAINSTFSGGA
jgi:hypothetical protein